jgi:hypothetical protein
MLSMERVWDEAKAHPYLSIGGVLFLVVIIWYFWARGSSTPATSTVGTPVQDPNLLAQQTAEFIAQNQSNAAVATANIQAASDQAINAQNTAAAVAISTAQNTSAQNINASNNATAITLANLQARTTFGTNALAAVFGEKTVTQTGAANYGYVGGGATLGNVNTTQSVSYSPSAAASTNVKPWTLALGDMLFGNADPTAQGSYQGPGGQTANVVWAKYLGWIGGAQVGGNTSWDQTPNAFKHA